MRSLLRIFAPVVATIGLAFSAGAAHAATQVHIFNIPKTDTDWNQLLTIPKFNPFNGTLTMVTVKITASFKATVDVENLSTSPAQMTATENITVNVDPTPAVQWFLDPIAKMFTDTAMIAARNGTSNFTGADTVHFVNESRIELTREFTSATDLMEFTRMGSSLTWDIAAGGVGTNQVSGTTTEFHEQTDLEAGLKVKVKYSYDIPEPASASLLALGMLLIGRRRRNRS